MAINQNFMIGTIVTISANDNSIIEKSGIISEIRNEGQTHPYGIELDGEMIFFEENQLSAA